MATYNEQMGYNVLPESLGALKRINASGEVEHLGNVWHTDRPYNVFPTRMLSIDDALHLCAGYGNLDELLRYNSLASGADNAVHIVYGKTLHYVLPRFSPSGSVYAALASLAKSVNATLTFEKNVVMITDRRPTRALADGVTGTGTGDIGFSDANKTFPSSGYLLIGKEILKYSGISGGVFTGIQRGVLASEIANHANNAEILYLDTLIETEKLGSPYKAITLQSDTNRIFNIIRDSSGIAEVRDEESIALYGERPYTLDLGLTRHEKAWIEAVFRSYLEELKDLQQLVNIQTVPDFSLRLGQIVPFFYATQVKPMRIVSVRYERTATHIKGRMVSLFVPTPVPTAVRNLRASLEDDGETVRLRWDAPENAGTSNIDHYEWKRTDDTTWNDVGRVLTATAAETAPGSVTYQVRAVGESGTSPVATVTATIPVQVPGSVRNFTGSASGTTVTLEWMLPENAAFADIQQSEWRKGTTGAWNDAGNALAVIFTESEIGTITYQVRVVGSAGTSPVGAVRVTTAAAPATVPSAPMSLTADGNHGGGRVFLDWEAPMNTGGSAILRYEYQIDGGAWVSTGSTDTEQTVTGLTNGTAYAFAVRAVNAVGASVASATASATPITVPAAPTGLMIRHTATTAILDWEAPTHIGGSPITDYEYQIDGGAWVSIGAADTEWTVTGLTTHTVYAFRVRSVNAAGEGAISQSVSVTPGTAPGAPTNLTTTQSSATEVELSWDAITNDGGSDLLRYEYQQNSGAWVSTGDTDTQYTVTGLSQGQTYRFKVRAVTESAAGPASNEVSVSTNLFAPSWSTVPTLNGTIGQPFTPSIRRYVSAFPAAVLTEEYAALTLTRNAGADLAMISFEQTTGNQGYTGVDINETEGYFYALDDAGNKLRRNTVDRLGIGITADSWIQLSSLAWRSVIALPDGLALISRTSPTQSQVTFYNYDGTPDTSRDRTLVGDMRGGTAHGGKIYLTRDDTDMLEIRDLNWNLEETVQLSRGAWQSVAYLGGVLALLNNNPDLIDVASLGGKVFPNQRFTLAGGAYQGGFSTADQLFIINRTTFSLEVYDYSASTSGLPDGITFNDGQFGGIPTAASDVTLDFRARNTVGFSESTVRIVVTA